jgi:hypothetical protein
MHFYGLGQSSPPLFFISGADTAALLQVASLLRPCLSLLTSRRAGRSAPRRARALVRARVCVGGARPTDEARGGQDGAGRLCWTEDEEIGPAWWELGAL